MSGMDLAELRFQVNTEKLKEAAVELDRLATKVDGLNKPLQDLSKNADKAGHVISSGLVKPLNDAGTNSDKASKGLSAVEKIIVKTAESLRVLRNQSIEASDGAILLGDGFTKSQSNMLAHLKVIGATREQLHMLAFSYKQVNEISGINKFDQATGGLARIRKEAEELSRVNELMAKGLNLTRDEIVLLSRDMKKLEQSFVGTELGTAQSKLMTEFAAAAKDRNAQMQIAKESERKAKEEAEKRVSAEKKAYELEKIYTNLRHETWREWGSNVDKKSTELQALAEFYRKEEEAIAAVNRELEKLNQKQRHEELVAQYRQGGASRSTASTAARLTEAGASPEVVNSYLQKATAIEKATKAQMDQARAQEYVTNAEDRLHAQIEETNLAMRQRYTDAIVKFEKALKTAGYSSDIAAAKAKNFRTEIEKLASKDHARELNYLARAISVQMGDVAISLASGMNPLLVMIQQGDQIRGVIQQAGAEGKVLQNAMMTAAGQIAISFIQTGKAIGQFFVGSLVQAAEAVMKMSASLPIFSHLLAKSEANMKAIGDSSVYATKAIDFLNKSSKVILASGIGALAATLIVISTEMYKVMKASTELNKSLVLTGAQFGMTKEQAVGYAEALSKDVGKNTLDVIRIFSQVAKEVDIPANALSKVTKSAIEMQKYAGVAVEDTVKQYKDLAKEPAKALLDIAKNTGLVSLATIQHIEQLEKQGDKVKAVSAAFEAYDNVTSEVTKRLKQDLTPFERLIVDIKEGFDKAKQSVYDFAKEGAGLEAFRTVIGSVAILAIASAKAFADLIRISVLAVKLAANIRDLDAQGEALSQYFEESRNSADEFSSSLKKLMSWTAGVTTETEKKNGVDTETLQRQSELTKAYENLKGVTKQYSTEVRTVNDAYKELQTSAQAFINTGGLLGPDGKTDPEKLKKFTEEMAKYQKAIAEKFKPKKDPVDSAQEQAIKRFKDLVVKQVAVAEDLTQAEKELLQLRNSEDWKKFDQRTKDQIENYVRQASTLEFINRQEKEYVKRLEESTKKAHEKWKEIDNLIVSSIDNQIKIGVEVKNETDLLQTEVRLLGMSAEERKRSLAVLKVQAEYEKEIADIRKTYEKTGDKTLFDEQMERASEFYRQRMINVNTEIALDFAKQIVEQVDSIKKGISESIASAIIDGGKAGRQKLRDLIVSKLRERIVLEVDVLVNTIYQKGLELLLGATGGTNGSVGSNIGTYVNAANTGSNAYAYGSKLYSGYQSGGFSGAWNSAFGGSAATGSTASAVNLGTVTSSDMAAAYTYDSASAAVAADSSVTSSMSGSSWALYAAAIYLGVKKAMSDYDEGFNRQGAENLSNSMFGSSNYFTPFGGQESTRADFFSKLGMSDKWADLFSGSTAVAKIFGRAAPRAEEFGIQGTVGSSGFSGQSFQNIYEKGGIFRKSKWSTQFGDVSSEIDNMMDEIASKTRTSIKELGESLGLATDQFEDVAMEVKIEFGNFKEGTSEVSKLSQSFGEDLSKPFEELSDRAKEFTKGTEFKAALKADNDKIIEQLNNVGQNYANALVDSFNSQIKDFSKIGETAADTITRLATSAKVLNERLELVGLEAFAKTLKGGADAEKFAELFGGLDKAASALDSYFKDFFTDTEKLTIQNRLLGKEFEKLNVELPKSKEQFKALVESAREAGDDQLLANLLKLAPAFAELNQVLITSEEVMSTFYGMAEKFFSNEDLKNVKLGEIIYDLGKAGIQVSSDFLQGIDATKAFNHALELFGQGMYEQANAILLAWEKLNEILVTREKVLAIFDSVADQLLEKEDLKNYRADQVVKTLQEGNITDITTEMVKAATATDVYNLALDYFNQGLYEKAALILSLTDEVSDINPEGFERSGKSRETIEYEKSLERLTGSKDLLVDLYDDQIDSIDSQITALEKEIKAREDARESARKNIDTLKKSMEDIVSFRNSISELRRELRKKLIVQNPRVMFAELLGFANKAKSGDFTVLKNIEESSREYVQYAEDTSSTYLDYLIELSRVQGVLSEVESSANSQISSQLRAIEISEKQLSMLESSDTKLQEQIAELQKQKIVLEEQKNAAMNQYNALMNIHSAVLTIPAALENFKNAVLSYQSASQSAVSTAGGTKAEAAVYTAKEATDHLSNLYLMGLSKQEIIDSAKLEYGASEEDVITFGKLARIPGFANGGSYGGGLAMTGEVGRELINFNKPGTVHSSAQTEQILRNASGDVNSELIFEIRSLRSAVISNGADMAKVRKILEQVNPEGDTIKVSFVEPQDVNVV